ncbi:MAG: 50S ribosomal L9 C-terminal domain-containing protein, partial [Polaribacter sp.]|nr:50S ribosomal L9 C-terminal domain-containing protein [Polaribacter sp.]
EDLMNNLKKIEITIEVEVGGEDRLFGSVTSQNIHEALVEKGIEVDRHAILLEEPIKALGIYDIPIKITKGLNQEVKVYVIQA